MQPVITSIIDAALAGIRQRHGEATAATSLVHALSRVRLLVDQQGGPAMGAQLESSLRTQVLGERLRFWTMNHAPATRCNLPIIINGDDQRRADAIMTDAVMTCLAFNLAGDENRAVDVTARTLTDRLCRSLHGAPEWDELRRAITQNLPLVEEDEGEEDDVSFGGHLRSFMIH